MLSVSRLLKTLRMALCPSFSRFCFCFSPGSLTPLSFVQFSHYVDESTAKSKGLVSSTKDRFTLRADDFTKLSAAGRGRDSFRVRSKKQYTTHVAVYVIMMFLAAFCRTLKYDILALI